MRRIYLTIALLLTVLPGKAHAERALLCPPPLPERVPTLPAPGEPEQTLAAADHATSDQVTTELFGDVEVRRGQSLLAADYVRLEREREWAEARGNVHLQADTLFVDSARAEFELDSGRYDARESRYRESEIPAQGRAGRIIRESEHVTHLERATFSTCPWTQEDWHLATGRLTLDTETNQGTARNTSLWFKGVPLLYTPWFRFPLGPERQSGFLPPSIGASSSSGTEIATPYYLNLAPNYDATITPRFLERRGTQIGTELRWLNQQGYWQLEHEYLDDRRFGDERSLTHLEHSGRLGQGWRTEADITSASDDQYFDDLTTDLSVNRRTHLRRRADLSWSDARTDFQIRAQNFQTLNDNIAPENRPYEQLPRITLNTGDAIGMLDGEIDTEVVRYTRVDSDETLRTRIVPSLTLPMATPGWFFRPRLAIDHTDYQLDRVTTQGDERISRTVPISSVDAGLVFERWTDNFRQTLEPRVYYLYVPHVDQDDIPIFDSSRPSFSFGQMFRERRFSGGDRIGDANQLTAAVSSRLFERATGREVVRASVGVVNHFADREITLPDEPVEERNTSDIIGELFLSPHRHWRSNTSVQWDPEEEVVQRGTTSLSFRGDEGGEASVGYRYTRDSQEVINAGFVWPASFRWRLLGRTSYSLEAGQNLETLAGLEYRSCCWTVRSVLRQYISGDGGELSDAYYIELVLNGLGGFGDTGSLIFP